MPRFKPYTYEEAKLIPVDLRRQLQRGTFEFAVNQIIDELDLTVSDARFQNEETGAPAYEPDYLRRRPLCCGWGTNPRSKGSTFFTARVGRCSD